VISFESGEALKLTTAKYYTPSGRLIQKVDYFHEHDSVIVRPSAEERSPGFATRNGRPVEGGGGIDPDIVLPNPKPGPLGTELWRQGAFFDFATEYQTKHPTLTNEKLDDAALEEFRGWMSRHEIVYDMDGTAELKTLRELLGSGAQAESAAADFAHLDSLLSLRRDQDFASEKEFIRHSVEQEIANSLWGPRGRIEATFDDDAQIQRAVEVLDSQSEYRKVLAVDDSAPKKQ
jgi:carboxyl-terminal processing protease